MIDMTENLAKETYSMLHFVLKIKNKEEYQQQKYNFEFKCKLYFTASMNINELNCSLNQINVN
jgi:hypothetical protein